MINRIAWLMSEIIFVMLLSCVIYFSVCLFSLDQVTEIDSTLRLRLMAPMPVLIVTWVYCYYSEATTKNSFAIASTAYDSMWYNISTEQQKAIILILARAQRVFRLQGLGLIDCSFRIYLSVISSFLNMYLLYSEHISLY